MFHLDAVTGRSGAFPAALDLSFPQASRRPITNMKTFALGILAALVLTSCSSTPGDKSGSTIELFNGKDLKGWEPVLADTSVKPEEVWTVQEGAIICKGTPIGFIYKGDALTNFRLMVEYRWAPGAKPGNSGLFSRINGPKLPLPRCVEVQLMHGNAGDVLGLQGMKVAGGQERFFEVKKHELAGDISGVKKTQDKENPPGEWNRVEVLAEGENYSVWMNGQLINQVRGVETTAGPIGLQSEGGEIHFRKVTLTPLP